MVVDKNALMCRDADGKLLPVEVDSKMFAGTVKVLPIRKGDISKMAGTDDSDDKLVEDFLVEPKLSIEQIKDLPLRSKRELAKLILKAGGLSDEEIRLAQEQNLKILEEELKKK